MTLIRWLNGASGDWSNASMWHGGVVPGAGDDAVIDASGTYTVTVSTPEAPHSVTLDAAGGDLAVSSSLSLTGTFDALAGTVSLNSNGIIHGGTIVDGGSGFVFSGATLDGVTFDGTVDLAAQSSSLYIGAGGLVAKGADGTGDGTVVLGTTGNYFAQYLYVLDSQTLDHATIDLVGYSEQLYQYTSSTYYYATSPNRIGTLTLGAHSVVDQTGSYDTIGSNGYGGGAIVNQGTINASTGRLTISPTRFANQGAIAVTGGDATTINAGTFSNTGTMTVSGTSTLSLTLAPGELGHVSVAAGSTLVLGGSFTTADLANLSAASGAVVQVSGTMDNTGATLSVGTGKAIPALTLTGSIHGGTIVDGGSGFVFSGGTLDGVTYDGTVDLTVQSSQLFIGANGIVAKGANGTGDGTVVLGSSGNYNAEYLYVIDSQTLDHATIDLAGYSSQLYEYTSGTYYYATTPVQLATLTLGAHLVVDQTGSYDTIGSTGYGGAIVNQGTINASSGHLTIGPTRFANQGSIAVTGGDSTTINAGTFSNTGTMTVSGDSTLTLTLAPGELGHVSVAAGSTLVLGGSFTTADLANLSAASGAVVQVAGTLNNTGATLSVGTGKAIPALTLNSNGTIHGGTIVDGGSGFVFSGGTLDGVTYDGTVDLTAQSSSLYIGAGGLVAKGANGTGDGTVVLGSSGNYNAEYLYVLDTQTIDHATVDLAGYSSQLYQYTSYNYYYATTPNQIGTLTLGAHLVVDQTGSYDTIGSNGYGGGVVVNQGTINASSGHLTIGPTRFSNQGSIVVSGGDGTTINAGTFSNTGTMTVSGDSTLTLTLAPGELGHVSVAAGSTLVLGGSFTTADLANLSAASGAVVQVAGTLDNTGATLSVGTGKAIPALTLNSNGTIHGGTIVDGGSGFVFSGGTLDGVTYDGTVDLTAQSASLSIGAGGLVAKGANGTGDGTVVVGSSGNYNAEQIYFLDSQTVDHATIDLAGYSAQLYQYTSYGYYYGSTPNQIGTLTLGAHLVVDQTGSYDTIGGTGYGGGVVVNQGTINASSGSLSINPTRFANQGTIAVSGGDSATISAATFSNTGTMTVTGNSTLTLTLAPGELGHVTVAAGSTLILGGSFTTADLAQLQAASGAVVKITGTLDNTGATLSVGTGKAIPALTLNSNGTIHGGTIVDGGSGFVFSGGTLDGVTYDGTVDLTAQSAQLFIGANGIVAKGANGTGDGTFVLGSSGNYNAEYLYVLDTQTIDHATVDLAGYSSQLYQYTSYNYYYATTPNQIGTLTLGAHLVVDQTGSYDSIASNGYGGGVVVNQGSINASSGHLTIGPTRFSNQGSIVVSGGDGTTINAGTFSNTGTMTVSGDSTLTLTLAPGELGHVSVASGSTLVLGGSFTTADLANLSAASGAVVQVAGTLNNTGATLSVGTGKAIPR